MFNVNICLKFELILLRRKGFWKMSSIMQSSYYEEREDLVLASEEEENFKTCLSSYLGLLMTDQQLETED